MLFFFFYYDLTLHLLCPSFLFFFSSSPVTALMTTSSLPLSCHNIFTSLSPLSFLPVLLLIGFPLPTSLPSATPLHTYLYGYSHCAFLGLSVAVVAHVVKQWVHQEARTRPMMLIWVEVVQCEVVEAWWWQVVQPLVRALRPTQQVLKVLQDGEAPVAVKENQTLCRRN